MIKLFKLLLTRNNRPAVERYLADSTDLVELERRQRELARKGIY